MKNEKGFTGMLISVIIAIIIIVAIIFIWQKMSVKSLQKATEEAAKEAGVEVNTENASPQGQVNAVRDMMNKIKDKKNSEIENELKK